MINAISRARAAWLILSPFVAFLQINLSGEPLGLNFFLYFYRLFKTANVFFFFTVRQVGYDNELRGAMSYVFGSSIVCDSLDIAKQVQAVSVSSSL